MEIDDKPLTLALNEVIELDVLRLMRLDQAFDQALLCGRKNQSLKRLVVPLEGFDGFHVELDCTRSQHAYDIYPAGVKRTPILVTKAEPVNDGRCKEELVVSQRVAKLSDLPGLAVVVTLVVVVIVVFILV